MSKEEQNVSPTIEYASPRTRPRQDVSSAASASVWLGSCALFIDLLSLLGSITFFPWLIAATIALFLSVAGALAGIAGAGDVLPLGRIGLVISLISLIGLIFITIRLFNHLPIC